MNNCKTNGTIFLISIPIVIAISVLSLVIFHVEKLPDPLNVIVILIVAFGPASLMFYYFITRFWLKMRLNKEM